MPGLLKGLGLRVQAAADSALRLEEPGLQVDALRAGAWWRRRLRKALVVFKSILPADSIAVLNARALLA